MKKLLVITLLAFLLVGCSNNSSTKISNGSELVWSSPKESYTKQDLYEDMKNNDYSSVISNAVLKTIALEDGIDMESIVAELEETYDSYIEMLGDYTVSYFGDKDYFVNTMLVNSIVEKYISIDVEENLDKYVEENSPYQAYIFYVNDEDIAESIKDIMDEGKNTLEYAATEAGYNETIQKQVYTDKSDLPIDVKEVVLNAEAPLFTVVPVETFNTDSNGNSTSSTRYYVVNVLSKDVIDFKDDFIQTMIGDTDSKEFIQKLISSHDVRFYDQSAYDSFSSIYEGAK